MDPWILRLKDAVDSGYYTTEAAEGQQEPFPWQNKTCQSCPFWRPTFCEIRAEYRLGSADTCHLFEPGNHALARRFMAERMRNGRRWWDWFRSNGGGGQPA